MVLYMIGLGLGDEKDITVRGLEAVRSCDTIVLEHYTSILGVNKDKLEQFYGKSITIADRNAVECEAEAIYSDAKSKNVAFLVVGDPLCATTHTDLMLRAKKLGIEVEVIHNASVMGAAASCGLQLYQFGYTVSVPLWEGDWKPDSFHARIKHNLAGGMHTLCLLDIKVKEPDFQAMATGRGRVKFLPPRFMTIRVALQQLLAVEEKLQEGVYGLDTMAVGLARLGQPTQKIVAGPMQALLEVDFGGPLHSLVICGPCHEMEQEFLEFYKAKDEDKYSPEQLELLVKGEESGDDDSDEDDGNIDG